MTTHLKSYPDGLCQLFVRAEISDVNAVFRRAATEMQKNYQMQGFRKGKVPVEIIEKQNPPELLSLTEHLFTSDAVSEIKSQGITLFGKPRFNPLSGLSRDKEFTFALVFEEYPAIKNPPDFSKTTFEYEECILDDKFIAEISCKQTGLMESVSSAAQDGDMVQVDVLNKDYTGTKPSASFDAAKMNLLVGKKIGDKISITFDDLGGYLPEFLGKVSNPLEVEIKEISRPKAWDKVTDEEISEKSPFKTKDACFTATKTQLENMVDQINSNHKTDALTKTIGKKLDISIPKSLWLNNLRDLTVKTAENDVIRAEISLDDLHTKKEIMTKFSHLPLEAKEGIAFVFWADYISKEENITIEGTELDYYIYRYAQQEKMSMADFQKRLRTEDRQNIEIEALREKTITHLLKTYTFKASSTVPFSEIWKKR